MEYSAAFSVISSNMYTWHTFNEGCWPRNTPSKHAGSDQEAFWLLPVMASMQPESARIVYARSDFSHPFQFCFSKEGMDHIAQNRPASDLDGLVRVWAKRIWSGSKLVCRNHLARFLAGRNRPATSFPLSDSVPFFHRRPG